MQVRCGCCHEVTIVKLVCTLCHSYPNVSSSELLMVFFGTVTLVLAMFILNKTSVFCDHRRGCSASDVAKWNTECAQRSFVSER